MKHAIAMALGLAASGVVFANDMATDPSAYEAQESATQQQQSALDALTPGDIEGKNVMSSDGQKVGDVDAVVYGSENGEKLAIIGLAGVIGDGAKEIAVPMDSLMLADTGDHLVVSSNKATLDNQPDVDVADYEKVESSVDDATF